MSASKSSIPVVLGLIAIGIIIGVVLVSGFNVENKGIAADTTAIPEFTSNMSSVEESEPGTVNEQDKLNAGNFNPGQMFVGVVKKVRPSIVTIYTTKNVKMSPNPWHRFFRDFGLEENQRGQQGEEQQREYKQSGLGSGIIISKDGYILTNHHVIKEVDELIVQMVNGEEYEAKVIGTDPTTEVALIKIDADDLPVAKLGNSDNIELGEWVLAIGSPLELNFTVTAGIVSALSRDINIIRGRNASYGIENFIQTDAAINPGNSGGALINARGEVIGINTAIATPTGNYVGYGFAIPINIAKNVMHDFRKYGEIRRGYLGVYIEKMDPVKTKGVGLDKPRGVFISSVIEGQAADKAGIKAGDVILSVEGTEVNLTNQLQAKVSTYDPGEEIKVVIWRDGSEKTIRVKLQAREGGTVLAESSVKKEEKRMKSLGLKIRDLSKRELDRFDLEAGVLIQAVDNSGPARKAGLAPNDVIYEIDGKNMESVNEMNDYIEGLDEGEIIKMKIRRRNANSQNFDRLVFMELPKE